MNPEEQIQKRLENTMRNLALELKARDIDTHTITCTFMVTWQDGAATIEPVTISKSKARTGKGENA